MAHGSSPTIAQEPEGVKAWQKGDTHPETGEVFMAYDRRCTTGERWSRVEDLPKGFFEKLEVARSYREWRASAAGGWNPNRQWSRGDIHPETGLVFWDYKRYTSGVTARWLPPGEFAERHQRVKQKALEYKQRDHEARKRRAQRWYRQNKEKCQEGNKRWARENAHRVQYYKRHRYQTDPVYQLQRRLRTRTRHAFLNSPFKKNSKTFEMIGCTQEVLFKHIEDQFTEGMSWDRLGEIEIDHIIPLSSAQTEEELIKLCHYTNLQPLWAEHNRIKGALMPEAFALLDLPPPPPPPPPPADGLPVDFQPPTE